VAGLRDSHRDNSRVCLQPLALAPNPQVGGKIVRMARNRASVVPLRETPKALPGSRPAGSIACAGLRWWRRKPLQPSTMSLKKLSSNNTRRTDSQQAQVLAMGSQATGGALFDKIEIDSGRSVRRRIRISVRRGEYPPRFRSTRCMMFARCSAKRASTSLYPVAS
jgi:hypothetical protein